MTARASDRTAATPARPNAHDRTDLRRRALVRPWPVAPSAPVRRSGVVLLSQASQVLGEARVADTAAERYRLAHLAALRAAAALLAERTQPAARQRPTNVWVLLSSLAPDLRDWSAYFAAGASARAAIEAGSVSAVTAREADDLVRAAGQFVVIIESAIGLLAAAS